MKRPVTSGAETTNPATPSAPFASTGSAADPAAAPAAGLDGIPRQRPLTVSSVSVEGVHVVAESVPAAAERAPAAAGSARPRPLLAPLRRVRPWRLFPTPTGTPSPSGTPSFSR
ncbi:hypothetical protein [Streptomyces phaeochromogenes]|uniref:hypothetical protein n=1 Tax=Streptomyces phaeochromogenes TaxID=1923 RepID=UPI003F4D4210